MKLKPFTPEKYRRRIFSQLWMLALQFVLGMILNLVDSDSTGSWHVLYVTVLVIHILNAIGLVEGAIYIGLKESSRLAWWTAAMLGATLGAGVLNVQTGNDAWSFVMALGFAASAWMNGVLYVRADRQLRSNK